MEQLESHICKCNVLTNMLGSEYNNAVTLKYAYTAGGGNLELLGRKWGIARDQGIRRSQLACHPQDALSLLRGEPSEKEGEEDKINHRLNP